MKIYVDADECTGHGRCYTLAPEVFEADDAGYGSVIRPEVPEELRAAATIGVQNCPERAIFLED